MYKLVITELSCKIKEFNRMIRSIKGRTTHLKKSITYRTKSTNNQDIKYILQSTSPVRILMLSTSLRKNLHLFSPINQKRFINILTKENSTGPREKLLTKQPFLSPVCKCSFCTQYQKFYWNSCKFIDVNKELMVENEIAYFKKSINYLQERISSFFNEQIGEEEALKAIDDSVLNFSSNSSSNEKDNKLKKIEDNSEKKIPAQTCAKENKKVADGLKHEKKILEQESPRKKTKAKKYFSTRLNRIARPDLRKEKPPKFVISKYKFISTQKQIKKQPKMNPIKIQNTPISNKNATPEKSNDILSTIRIAFDLIKTIGENKIKDIKKQIKMLQAKFLQRSADVKEDDELKKDNLMQMKKEDGNKDEQNKDEGTDKKAQQLNEKPHIEKIKNDLKSAIESNYRETFGNTFKEKSKILKDAKKTAGSKRDLKDFDEVTTKHKCLITLKSLKQDIKKGEPKENRMYNLKNFFNFNVRKNKSKIVEKSKSNVSLKSTKSTETPQKKPDINVKSMVEANTTSETSKFPVEKTTKSDTAIQIAKKTEIIDNQSTQNQNLKTPDDKKSDFLIPEETKSNLTLTSIYQEQAENRYKRLENVKSCYKCQKKGKPDDNPILLDRTKSILTLNSIGQDSRTPQGKEKPKSDVELKDLIEQINKEIQTGNESKTSLIDYKVTSMKGVIDELNNEILHRLKAQTNRKVAGDVKKSGRASQSKINTDVNLEGIRDDLCKEIQNKYTSSITKKLTNKSLKSHDDSTPKVLSKTENEIQTKPNINAVSNETKSKLEEDVKADKTKNDLAVSKDHLPQSVEENANSLEQTLDEMQTKKSSSRHTNWLVSKKIFSAEVAKSNKTDCDLSPCINKDQLDAVKMKQDMLNDVQYEKHPAERLMKIERSENNIEDKLERPSITPQPNPPPKKDDDKKKKVPPVVPKNSMILPPRNAPDNPKLDSKLSKEGADKEMSKQAKEIDKTQKETIGDLQESNMIKNLLDKPKDGSNENLAKKMDEAKKGEAFEDKFKQVVHKNTVLLVPKDDPESSDKSKNVLTNINIDSIEELEIQYKDGSDKNLIKIAEEMDKAKNKETESFLPSKPPKFETMEGTIKAIVKPMSGNVVSSSTSYQLEGVFKIYKTSSTPDNSPTSTKPDPKKNWSNSNQLKGSLNIKDQGQKKTNPVKNFSDLAGNKLHDHSIVTCKESDSLAEVESFVCTDSSSMQEFSRGALNENEAVMSSKKDDDKSSKNNKNNRKNKRNKLINRSESFHKEKKSDRLIPKLIQRKGSIIVKEEQPKKKKTFRPTLTVVYTKKNRKKIENHQTNKKRKEQTRRRRKSRVRRRRRNIILFMLKDELKKNEQERFKSPEQPMKKSITPEEEIQRALSKYKFKTPTEVANDFSAVPMRDMERNRKKQRENMKKSSFYRNLDKKIFSKGKGGEKASKNVGGTEEKRQHGSVQESGSNDGKSNAVLTKDEEDDSGEPKSVLK